MKRIYLFDNILSNLKSANQIECLHGFYLIYFCIKTYWRNLKMRVNNIKFIEKYLASDNLRAELMEAQEMFKIIKTPIHTDYIKQSEGEWFDGDKCVAMVLDVVYMTECNISAFADGDDRIKVGSSGNLLHLQRKGSGEVSVEMDSSKNGIIESLNISKYMIREILESRDIWGSVEDTRSFLTSIIESIREYELKSKRYTTLTGIQAVELIYDTWLADIKNM